MTISKSIKFQFVDLKCRCVGYCLGFLGVLLVSIWDSDFLLRFLGSSSSSSSLSCLLALLDRVLRAIPVDAVAGTAFCVGADNLGFLGGICLGLLDTHLLIVMCPAFVKHFFHFLDCSVESCCIV
eukprot:TRINITY_DN1902_c0_g1_i2.p1 TRINITY_DN1902_c0_g1~~TRINITY_DN1902_c0_g1_i2.p1  ORF type:complete len:125 (-),score=17.04 TRINITY_DN1902_c0_g1_i2:141-515(-)